MAWNGSDNTGSVPVKKPAGVKPAASGSVPKVLLAAAVVVALCAAVVVYFLLRGSGKPAPKAPEKPSGGKIVEVTPAPAKPKGPSMPTKPPEEKQLSTREKRLKYYREKYGNNIPDNLKPVVYFLEHPPQKTFKVEGDTPYLRHPSERHIAGLILVEPGTLFVMKPEYGEAFDKDFLNALMDKIEIYDDDPEDVKRVKEEVEQVKKEISAICRKEGKIPSEIMNEQAAAMFELGRYQRDLEDELDKVYDNPDLTDDEAGDFFKAANKLLESKGLAPLALPDMSKRSLRLVYNERVAARKAAQKQQEQQEGTK